MKWFGGLCSQYKMISLSGYDTNMDFSQNIDEFGNLKLLTFASLHLWRLTPQKLRIYRSSILAAA